MSGFPVNRSCANCCSYSDGECLNGAGQVEPGGCCDDHETEAEFWSDVTAFQKFRERIGLPPRRTALGED